MIFDILFDLVLWCINLSTFTASFIDAFLYACTRSTVPPLLLMLLIMVGVGKEGRKSIGPWGYCNEQLALFVLVLYRSRTSGSLLWWTLGGEPYQYACAWPDKLGIGWITHGDSDGNSSRKWEGDDRNPVS